LGYTHYWNTKPSISKDKWGNFTNALKVLLSDPIAPLALEYNQEYKKPSVTKEQIRFNGIGEDGHETFYIKRKDKPADWAMDKETVFGFCKTANKPYDVYVTASLLLAKLYLEDEISISSDGEVSCWQAGVELINNTVGKEWNFKLDVKDNPDAEYPDSIGTALINWEKIKELA